MKKIMILLILLIIPLANSLTLEQKKTLEKTINAVDTKSDFEKLMNLLNEQNIDLSNEEKIVNNINSLAERFDVNLADYSNINGLEIEFAKEIEKPKEKIKTKIIVNWIQILPIMFIAILVLIVEIYRFKSIEETVKEETPSEDHLKKYVKDAVEKGYTKEEIKKILIEHNWDENLIDDILNQIVSS